MRRKNRRKREALYLRYVTTPPPFRAIAGRECNETFNTPTTTLFTVQLNPSLPNNKTESRQSLARKGDRQKAGCGLFLFRKCLRGIPALPWEDEGRKKGPG